MNPLTRLIAPIFTLFIIGLVGLIGYHLLEGWSFIDSLYMLVITLSTVGFREVHDLSPAGRILTMGVIIAGVGTAVYFAGQLAEIIVEGQIFGYRRKVRMQNKIKDLKDHYIICGFGRVGHQVAYELEAAKIPYLVIDVKEETARELEPKGIPYVIGDPTSDNQLKEAGIEKARGLIAAADSDVANVYVTLSARSVNKELYIVARASRQESEDKMKFAGANRVISPYYISGRRIAALATKPVASDFLDMVMHGEHLDFSLQEVSIKDHSHLVGKSIADAQIRQKSGATILAIRKADGAFNLQPLAASKIEAGDILVVIGTQDQLEILDGMAR